MGISILVTKGTNRGKNLSFDGTKFSIGRDASNEFTVEDKEVSRCHCHIEMRGNRIWIVDNNSSNGTFLNEEKVSAAQIIAGDEIRVGQTILQFELSDDLEANSSELLDETNVSEAKFDTLVMTLGSEPETEERVVQEDDGREFVQIQNDLRFFHKATLATSRQVTTLEMLSELLELIFEWIAADRGGVFLKDEASDSFKVVLFKNRRDADSPAFRVCEEVIDYVIDRKVGVLSRNPPKDFGCVPKTTSTEIGEAMCVPIQSRGGGMIGLFYVDALVDDSSKRLNRFSKAHLRLMLSVAHQAAIVTENESYIAALVEQEKLAAVGETTALLSHRINNILQGINGGKHILESGLEKNNLEATKEGWEIVKRNQGRVAQLILDLVFLSQPYEPIKEAADFSLIVVETLKKVEADSATQFVQEVSDAITGEIDSELLAKAIQNLLELCSSASQTNEVNVLLDDRDGEILLKLTYTGAEIVSKPKELANPAFDSSTRQFGGIELALCNKIIAGHEGTVHIEQTSVGTFQISLTIPKKST